MKQVFVNIVTIQGFSFAFGLNEEGIVLASSFNPETLKRLLKEDGYEPMVDSSQGRDIRTMVEKYFKGEKVILERIPVLMKGTDFQIKVWEQTRKIPYGKTITYGELAKKVNSSPRAVGMALSRNRIPLFIPCHRVIGKKGIGGFTPDVKIKRDLLKLEGGKP